MWASEGLSFKCRSVNKSRSFSRLCLNGAALLLTPESPQHYYGTTRTRMSPRKLSPAKRPYQKVSQRGEGAEGGSQNRHLAIPKISKSPGRALQKEEVPYALCRSATPPSCDRNPQSSNSTPLHTGQHPISRLQRRQRVQLTGRLHFSATALPKPDPRCLGEMLTVVPSILP